MSIQDTVKKWGTTHKTVNNTKKRYKIKTYSTNKKFQNGCRNKKANYALARRLYETKFANKEQCIIRWNKKGACPFLAIFLVNFWSQGKTVCSFHLKMLKDHICNGLVDSKFKKNTSPNLASVKVPYIEHYNIDFKKGKSMLGFYGNVVRKTSGSYTL